MSDPKYVNFKPRWMRNLTAEDERILDDTPATGTPPEVSPRINARLLPVGGSYRLSAKTLCDTISLTQALVRYAGSDLYHGPNPDFADLRSLSAEVMNLTRLSIEPFEPGSFIIPARLEADPLPVDETQPARQVTTEDVVTRFDEILGSMQDPSSAVRVSIGAIQTVEALGQVIRREAEAIEFSSFDRFGEQRRSVRVDEAYIGRVSGVKESRQPTRAKLETLEGKVTALDIREGKLQLSIEGQRRRVLGHFTMLFLPSLLESLGRMVQLHGHIEWQRGKPVSIQVINAKMLAEDA